MTRWWPRRRSGTPMAGASGMSRATCRAATSTGGSRHRTCPVCGCGREGGWGGPLPERTPNGGWLGSPLRLGAAGRLLQHGPVKSVLGKLSGRAPAFCTAPCTAPSGPRVCRSHSRVVRGDRHRRGDLRHGDDRSDADAGDDPECRRPGGAEPPASPVKPSPTHTPAPTPTKSVRRRCRCRNPCPSSAPTVSRAAAHRTTGRADPAPPSPPPVASSLRSIVPPARHPPRFPLPLPHLRRRRPTPNTYAHADS